VNHILLIGILTYVSAFAVDYRCDDPKWNDSTVDTQSIFHGEVEANCTFPGVKGGSFTDLKTELARDIVAQAKTVFAGPKEMDFHGLPATYFDLAVDQSAQGSTVTIRSDVYVATDGKTHLLNSSQSKQIEGEGMAANLQKLDAAFDVAVDAWGNYRLKITTQMTVTKPGIAPVGVFKNKVMQITEEELVGKEETLIEDLTKVL
jgi:hypothetical protein